MKNFPLLILCITLLLGVSCVNNKREQKNINEIKVLSDKLFEDNSLLCHDFQCKELIVPKRYKDYYQLYINFRYKLGNIKECLVDMEDNNNYIIDDKAQDRFQNFYNSIDNIYDSRVDTTYINKKIHTQKTYLEQYLNPLKTKVKECSSEYDVNMIRLYIALIEKHVLEFLNEKAERGLIQMNYIKPVTVKNGGNIDCYVAAVDTLKAPYIIIGKFKRYKYTDTDSYYHPEHIIDTIYFNKEKATYNTKMLNGNDAVLFFVHKDGSSMTYKLN